MIAMADRLRTSATEEREMAAKLRQLLIVWYDVDDNLELDGSPLLDKVQVDEAERGEGTLLYVDTQREPVVRIGSEHYECLCPEGAPHHYPCPHYREDTVD